MKERLFVWLGGTLFVASLAVCAYYYLIVWAQDPTIELIVHDPYEVSRHGGTPAASIGANTFLFGLFAMHHSVFARDGVKARLARIVPERLLRSVYVWTASALLLLVCALWQPLGGEAYRATGWRALAHALLQLVGLGVMAASVRVIDPLELAGIRRQTTRDALQVSGPYRWVRHPLYLGWILAVFGAAHMTGDRLAFAAISSLYLVIAVPWEERSLRESLGQAYLDYMQRVRWRIIPYVY